MSVRRWLVSSFSAGYAVLRFVISPFLCQFLCKKCEKLANVLANYPATYCQQELFLILVLIQKLLNSLKIRRFDVCKTNQALSLTA